MSLSTNFNAVNNQIDDISFGVLRTNPKLTTNVKLVVNSMGSLYMDSMEANSALSNTSFKKVPINPNGAYSLDISKFYNELPINLKNYSYNLEQFNIFKTEVANITLSNQTFFSTEEVDNYLKPLQSTFDKLTNLISLTKQ